MTKKDIEQILLDEGFKKVGFWNALFFYSRNKVEELKCYYFNKGIKNPKKLALFSPKLFVVNGKDYLIVTNNELFIKQI